MARKTKHSNREILALVAQADDLAGQGKLQPEIARTLGISVMTLHRWRKMTRIDELPNKRSGDVPKEVIFPSGRESKEGRRIAELEVENSRLRKLVTDLLLGKMRLEEEAKGQISGGTR
jgi:putative transposase